MNSKVDVLGDGGNEMPAVIRGFDHWWHVVQRQCDPRRATARELAKIAWNAALEKAARECGANQLSAASVNYAAVCRTLQIPTFDLNGDE